MWSWWYIEPIKLPWFTGLLRVYWSNWPHSHLALLKINHFLSYSLEWNEAWPKTPAIYSWLESSGNWKRNWKSDFHFLFYVHIFLYNFFTLLLNASFQILAQVNFCLPEQAMLPASFKRCVGSKLPCPKSELILPEKPGVLLKGECKDLCYYQEAGALLLHL